MRLLIVHLFKKSIRIEKRFGYLIVGYILSAGMIPYFGLLFLWSVAKRMTVLSTKMWVTSVFLFAMIEILFIIGNSYCHFSLDTTITSLRMMFGRELSKKLLEISYERLEDEQYLKKNYPIFHFLDGSHFGLHKIYVHTIQFLSLGLSFFLMVITISLKGRLYFPMILFYAIISIYFSFLSGKRRCEKREIHSNVERKIDDAIETINNYDYMKDFKIFHIDHVLSRHIKKWNYQVKKIYQSENRMDFVKNGILLGFILIGILLLIGWYTTSLLQHHVLEISDVIVISMILMGLLEITRRMAILFEELVYERTTLSAFMAFLEGSNQTKNYLQEETSKDKPLVIENLSFCYPHYLGNTLKGVNLEIKRGEKVALIGLNGAGKSTLIKCIAGLYPSYQGKIHIFGKDARSAKQTAPFLKILFQDTSLYPFLIDETIASTDQSVDTSRVVESIQAVGMGEVFENREDLSTRCFSKLFDEEGYELSGGQKEKLSIARLVYQKAPFMIFDEPTASLDAIAEKELIQKLIDQFKDQTILFTTHRLFATKKMDRLIVLQDGKIKESGTFQELMNLKSEFYRLYQIAGGFDEVLS